MYEQEFSSHQTSEGEKGFPHLPHASGMDQTQADQSANESKVVVLVCACAGVDSAPVEQACSSLGCEVHRLAAQDPWRSSGARANDPSKLCYADVTVFVGSSTDMMTNEQIRRARLDLGDSLFLAVLTDATFAAGSTAIKLGAHGVVAYETNDSQLASEIGWLIERARSSVSDRRATATHVERLGTLTRAEAEVLLAMLNGSANKEIAQLLSIGLRTVELRRSKIMRKMGAGNLAQLIKFVCLAGGEKALMPSLE